MKKNNVIIFALLALVSIFLLWLWYYLGFNRVDDPFDLVLSIIWWIVIVVAIVVIVRMEKTRRRRIRTVYVGSARTFNSEKGLMEFDGSLPASMVIASIIENLKYDFTRKDFPEEEDFTVDYFVRTSEFDTKDKDSSSAADGSASTASGDSAGVVSPAGASAAGAAGATSAVGAGTQTAGQPTEPKTWKGDVYIVATKEEKSFETPDELAAILATIVPAAA